MIRLTRSRAAVTTGFLLGTTTLGLAFAPAAFAAPVLTDVASTGTASGPSSVVAGEKFTVSGTKCLYGEGMGGDVEEVPASVAIVTDSLSEVEAEVLFAALPNAAGDWSTLVSFPADTPAGTHEIELGCVKSYNGATEIRGEAYDTISLTVTAPAAAPVTPVTTTDPTTETPASEIGTIRGVAANTAGVAPAASSAATTATPAPGVKVVKVYKGFQANEWVTITMHSTPTTLGTFQADANGVLTVEFTVPAGTQAGTHTLVLNGALGTYFQEEITVAAATAVAAASSNGLAYTGADVAVPLALGAGLLALGGGALVVSRRRAGATQA